MSIYETEIIDMISTNGNLVDLVLTDHLEWTDNKEEDLEHLDLLIAKLKKYIAVYETGVLFEKRPETKNKKIAIRIVTKYCPNKMAAKYISDLRDFLLQTDCKKLGLQVNWEDFRYLEHYEK